MKMTYYDLKNAYKSHIRKQVPSSREGCPSPEKILSVFDSSASSADKEQVVNHVVNCSDCFQEFELWLSFLREQGIALEEIIGWLGMKGKGARIQGKIHKILESLLGPRVSCHPLWKLAAGLLFTAALTGLIFIGIKSLVMTPDLKERGKVPGQIRLISPVQREKIMFPLVFRWDATPGVDYYCLELFDRTLLPLWKSSRLEGTRFELPPEAAELIKKNEVYFWMITAWLKDGMKKESSLEEFTLTK
jgi:hypothetical protein